MNASPHTIEPWVFHELGHANFGDARLTGRMIILANDLACHPEYSLASMYDGDWASLKASYRLFDNPSVTPTAMLAPHQHKAWERSGHGSWVLIAQDTSYFNYTSHPATQGLGPVERENDRGLLVHSALAMTDQGVPLGIAAQKIWTRNPDDFGKSRRRQHRPFAEKESARWVDIAQVAG
ncbi:MAG: transposase DNA-binding-containing protein [Firmicutes bacterium]|nr:transposase DNA-binding-containing protein [Bacillota bacterium]